MTPKEIEAEKEKEVNYQRDRRMRMGQMNNYEASGSKKFEDTNTKDTMREFA